MTAPRLSTVVVGAGPAGLLFAIVGRLLARRGGVSPEEWVLRVYDKREQYVRTHRLRMAPEPYLAIKRAVDLPAFDELIAFLEESDFAPEVNVLEERLVAMAADLGIEKALLAVGSEPGEASLADLRARAEAAGEAGPDTCFTIVGADSVHSAVREMVRGDAAPRRRTHEQLARIRVTGPGLARRLGAVDQVRLSKVLGSVIDYRLNKNGFAEVDLFLSPAEHERVSGLGATPRDPVTLSPSLLGRLRAPLFRAIVEHLERAPGGERRQVLLQSMFRLEHAVMPKAVFEVAGANALVFLVGDACISLPFQRGMSALAQCALALARVHVELATASRAERSAVAARYDAAVLAIERREVAIVRARAQLIGTLREIVRVSALLPFPIQSWWLRAPDRDRRSDRLSIWVLSNVAVAFAGLTATIGGQVLADCDHPAWGAVVVAGVLVQILGGVAYHAALAFEGGPHRLVRRVWETQIAAALVLGAAWLVWYRSTTGGWGWLVAPLWWLFMGGSFVVGLYTFEHVVTRWFRSAGLTFDDPAPGEAEMRGDLR